MFFARHEPSDPDAARQRLDHLVGAPLPSPEPQDAAPPASSPVGSEAEPERAEPSPGVSTDPSDDVTEPSSDGLSSRARRLSARIAEAFGVRGARVDPGRSGLRALAAVAVVVAVAAILVAWWQAPQPEPVAAPADARPAERSAGQPSATPTGVVVAVAGKVRKPGLVTLPSGARVADAIEAAGGLLPGAEVGYLNLARKVADGELIVVCATPPPGAVPGDGPGGGDGAAPAGKINLNTATAAQLETLPGVGPVLARNILDYRQEHGGFRSVGELRRVTGIGPARYAQLKDQVTV